MESIESKFNKADNDNEYIVETDKTISYLGVTLEKAEISDSIFVPDRYLYNDYINDPELSLPLQRDIAVSLLTGDPMLIEGGTSLGKSTTIMKMASELGYEVHYINLNGAVDVENLMGRYIPNANKKNADDPEYIFADGKVTSGLRQEEGKTKIIILDEFNACSPNILIRLHEVIDALERGGNVILSEDASEAIKVNKSKTKIFAAMNPPGKGYMDRSPLDPAQLRRWVYNKLPSDLPDSTFSDGIDGLFGFGQKNNSKSDDVKYLTSRDEAMLTEQLAEIPYIELILEKYKEFHKAAKELVKNRKIAQDQPQLFTFDDRMEPRRVRDFILRFYNGDINETFQNALRYYYSNKLEIQEDKDYLEEIIRQTECVIEKPDSKRKSLDDKIDCAPEISEFSQYVDGQSYIKDLTNYIEDSIPERMAALEVCPWRSYVSDDYIAVTLNRKIIDQLPDYFFNESIKTDYYGSRVAEGYGVETLSDDLKNKRVLASRVDDTLILKTVDDGLEYITDISGDAKSDIDSSDLIADVDLEKLSDYDRRFVTIKESVTRFYAEAKAKDVYWSKKELSEIVWQLYENGILLDANIKHTNLYTIIDSDYVFSGFIGKYTGIDQLARAYAEAEIDNTSIYSSNDVPYIKFDNDLPF